MTNDVFVHVGVPMPNIGAVRVEHEILSLSTPAAPAFEVYYQEVCDAELMQELGRDRALRRTGHIFHYWLTDLELPFAAQTMSAADLSLDAASQADITKAAITKAIMSLAKSGGKLTQQAIAQAAEVTQGWVSKFFANMGGWSVWRKIITSLLKASYRGGNNSCDDLEALSEDELWVAQEYLALLVKEFESDPVAAVDAVAAIALGYGATAWERILRAADRAIAAQLIGFGLVLRADNLPISLLRYSCASSSSGTSEKPRRF
jgi:tRNA A-37 threonylcarbamoyl transferase component Bud32